MSESLIPIPYLLSWRFKKEDKYERRFMLVYAPTLLQAKRELRARKKIPQNIKIGSSTIFQKVLHDEN